MSDFAGLMTLLQRRLERKVCALWHGTFSVAEDLGSGAFVAVGGKTFIATCAHIAKPFMTEPQGFVVLANGASIQRDSCSLLYADSALDLAILEVSGGVGVAESFSIRDFARIPDMAKHSFSDTSVLICGFPAERVGVAPTRRTMSPIIYLTGLDPEHPPTEQRFSCLYPLGAGEVIGESTPSALPKPHGLSGSLLFSVPTTSLPKEQLWTLENMRVIGVAVESNERSYLEAASIYPVLAEITRGEA